MSPKFSWFRVFVFSVALPTLAFAAESIRGKDAVQANPADYPNVCLLRISIEDLGAIYECTGTLVSKNVILSAAHCFDRDFNQYKKTSVAARCGKEVKYGSKVDLPGAGFWFSNEDPKKQYDIAKVTFNEAFSASPVTMAAGPDEFFDAKLLGEKRPNVKCFTAGFGLNSIGRESALMRWEIKKEDIQYAGNAIRITNDAGDYLETSSDDGDSGGPLFCAAGKGPMKLVGVTHGVAHLYSSDPVEAAKITANYYAGVWFAPGLAATK